MNLRRGLFRFRVLFAVLFSLSTAATSYTAVQQEFFWANPPKDLDFVPDLPVGCDQARGTMGTDYRSDEGLCWYQLPRFRELYTEYADLDEQELSRRIYAKAGRPLKELRPWRLVAKRTGIALGVPLAVLVLGWSVLWAGAGFKKP